MKTTISTSSPAPTKTFKQGPVQRLSLSVKKLDQLINRANQLGKLPLQVFNKDNTGKPIPLSETNPTQPNPLLLIIKLGFVQAKNCKGNARSL